MCTKGQNLGTDASGNPIFGDIGLYLKSEISKRLKKLGVEVRFYLCVRIGCCFTYDFLGNQHTIKYIDPSYTIRSAPCVASDAIFAVRLGQHACHAAMAGKTGLIVGMVQDSFVHLPIAKVTAFRKKVDIKGSEFQAFLDMSNMGLDLVH